ncbi:MAG: AAA family ATPase [Phycisphaerales bacterium]
MTDPARPDDPSTPQAASDAIRRFRDDYAAVENEIRKAIVGHGEIVSGVLTCLFAGGHALLEGAPGLGKTLLVRTLAQALRLSFNRVQFTPDLMPADVTGTSVVIDDEKGRRFVFQQGPIFAQIVLADEINRATPKTQSALLEAMQERSVTVAGTTHALPAPFFVMATQNPIEQEGTYPLPEAQLDRFFFKLLVAGSSRAELSEILSRTTSTSDAPIEAVLDAETLLAHQRLVRQVKLAPHVQDYAVRVVLATHPSAQARERGLAPPIVDRFVRFGASPRAAQTMILAGKVLALLDNRATVSIDDLKKVAAPALRHRVLLNFEGEAEGATTDQVVETILATLPIQAPAAQPQGAA